VRRFASFGKVLRMPIIPKPVRPATCCMANSVLRVLQTSGSMARVCDCVSLQSKQEIVTESML